MSSVYDFIKNKDGDTFSNNLLLNPEAEGVPPDIGTIAPWLSGAIECTCVLGGVDVYGDFVFKIPAVPSGSANTLNQSISSIPYTSSTMQVFGFFYTKEKLSVTQPTAHIKVSVIYNEDSIVDVFYMPVNVALDDSYLGEIIGIGPVNFYLAKSEFTFRIDKTIYSIVCTISNKDNVDMYCDNIAIRLNTNAPVGRSIYNERPMIDKYGLDTAFMDNYKNMVWNSSFEVADATPLNPDYWTGGTMEPDANFGGTYSLKLDAAESTIQSGDALINPNWFGGGIARVSFHCRK
jgi:hypothetical protein